MAAINSKKDISSKVSGNKLHSQNEMSSASPFNCANEELTVRRQYDLHKQLEKIKKEITGTVSSIFSGRGKNYYYFCVTQTDCGLPRAGMNHSDPFMSNTIHTALTNTRSREQPSFEISNIDLGKQIENDLKKWFNTILASNELRHVKIEDDFEDIRITPKSNGGLKGVLLILLFWMPKNSKSFFKYKFALRRENFDPFSNTDLGQSLSKTMRRLCRKL